MAVQTVKPVKSATLWPVLYLTLGWFGLEMAMALDTTQFQYLLSQKVEQAWVIGAVLSLGPLAGIVVQPAMGWITDVYAGRGATRKRFIFLGLVFGIFSTMLLALPLDLMTLIWVIALFFASFNVLMVSYRALVTEISNRRALLARKGVISGYIALFSGAGSFAMFFLCGLGSHTFWPYVIASVMLAVTFGLFFSMAPRPKGGLQPQTMDQCIPAGLLRPWNLAFYAVPVLGVMPPVERKVSENSQQAQIFRLFTVQFMSWMGIQALRGYFVLYVVEALNLAHAQANMLLAVTTMVIVAVSIPMGGLADRWQNRKLLGGCLLLYAVLLFFGYFLVNSLQSALVFCVLMGVCLSGLIVFPLSLLMKLCPPQSEGVYAGLYNLFISVPQLYSLMITGLLIDLCRDYHVILLVAGVSAFLGFLGATRLKPV